MLHSINLMPWREAQREEHKRRFVGLLVLGCFVAFGIQYGLGFFFQDQIDQQKARLNQINSYIAQLDARIESLKEVEKEHQSLLTRLKVVEELQVKRNKTTDFMNLIPHLIPEGVYVDKIDMNGQQISISGISDSTSRLATMLDNLERSPHLSNVEMHSIIHDRPRFNKKFQDFELSFYFDAHSFVQNVDKGESNNG